MALDYLPNNATKFEKSLIRDLSLWIETNIRDVVDPDRCPVEFLPFLAVHESVDLWYNDWTEARKRQMIKDCKSGLAESKGTRDAAQRFLSYVDTQVVHRRTYPSRFPVGRIAAGGSTPVNFPHSTAQYLLKLDLAAPKNAVCSGRTAVGRSCVQPVSFEPLVRANHAITISKAPDKAYAVTFAHRVVMTLDDGLDLGGDGVKLGLFQDRYYL